MKIKDCISIDLFCFSLLCLCYVYQIGKWKVSLCLMLKIKELKGWKELIFIHWHKSLFAWFLLPFPVRFTSFFHTFWLARAITSTLFSPPPPSCFFLSSFQLLLKLIFFLHFWNDDVSKHRNLYLQQQRCR